jgi:hypothetical protein
VGNLNFHQQRSADQSKAVQVLQQDDNLRQGVITHVFSNLTDRDQIFKTRIYKFDSHAHSGLRFYAHDREFVINLAFMTDNTELWASFMAGHKYHRNQEERGPDNLRRCMREQARKSLPSCESG